MHWILVEMVRVKASLTNVKRTPSVQGIVARPIAACHTSGRPPCPGQGNLPWLPSQTGKKPLLKEATVEID